MSEQCDRSFESRSILKSAKHCGCYYCCKVYSPSLIKEWVDRGLTAICPKCGIDSVVPFEKERDNTLKEFRLLLKLWNLESF